jgi:lactate 2-monooxygenase
LYESERRMQDERYAAGDATWPVSTDEWEARAQETLGRNEFDWVAGGAGEEWTIKANREAFERWRLRPRMLSGNEKRELAIHVLGTESPLPLLLAPIGGQTVVHPDGEVATARAAASTNVPMIVSQAASYSMEDIAQAARDLSRWYQLYWVSDEEVTESLLERAVASGHEAIVLTVDTPMVGWHDRGLRNRYVPFLEGKGIGQYVSDPVFRSRLRVPPEEDIAAAGKAVVDMFPNFRVTWDQLSWLRERTSLPLLVKGVLSADDALRARDAGIDGVIVSNHGGRQLDGEVAALDALVEVRAALGADAVVLVDSGVRRGPDVIKALALGADAVLVGRPYLYGLAVAGRAGVERVLETLHGEIDSALALVGGSSVQDVDRSFVTAAG